MNEKETLRVIIPRATAIVRNKPKEITGKEYAKILAQKLKKSEETWKNKAENLEKKLFETKQQNVYLRLKYEAEENGYIDGKEMEKMQYEETLVKTEEETKCNKRENEQISGNVQFLKTLVTLKCNVYSDSDKIDSDEVVKASIVSCIKGMTQSMKNFELNKQSLAPLEDSGEVIVELLKRKPDADVDLEMQDVLLKLLEELIRAIVQQTAASAYDTQNRLTQMVYKLGSQPLVIELLIAKLGVFIEMYIDILADHQEKGSIVHADKFENMCYILRIMEQLVVRAKTSSKVLSKAKDTIRRIMQSNIIRLTTSFPLFVRYVWKLTAIVETADMPTASENVNLWK